jgi:hypothetical protein
VEQNIKDNGKESSGMVKVHKFGKMVPSI